MLRITRAHRFISAVLIVFMVVCSVQVHDLYKPAPANANPLVVPVVLIGAAALVVIAAAYGMTRYSSLGEAAEANGISYQRAAFYHASFKQAMRDHNLLGQPMIQGIVAGFVSIELMIKYLKATKQTAAWNSALADVQISGDTAWVPTTATWSKFGIASGYSETGYRISDQAAAAGYGWPLSEYDEPIFQTYRAQEAWYEAFYDASHSVRLEMLDNIKTFHRSGAVDDFDTTTEATTWGTGSKYDRRGHTERVQAAQFLVYEGGVVTSAVATAIERMLAGSLYKSAYPVAISNGFDCTGSMASNTVKLTGLSVASDGGGYPLTGTLSYDTASDEWIGTVTLSNANAVALVNSMNTKWGVNWWSTASNRDNLTEPTRLAYTVTAPKAVPIHKNLVTGTAAQKKAAADAITTGSQTSGTTYDPSGTLTGGAVTVPNTVSDAIASPGAGLGEWVQPWVTAIEGGATALNDWAAGLHDLPAGLGEIVEALVGFAAWNLKAFAVLLSFMGDFLEMLGTLLVKWWTWAWSYTAATWTNLATTISTAMPSISNWWTGAQSWWAEQIAALLAAIGAISGAVAANFTTVPQWAKDVWDAISAPVLGVVDDLGSLLWPFRELADIGGGQ